MIRTNHMQERMAQRGLSNAVILATESFGTSCRDKVTLNREGAQRARKVLERLWEDLQQQIAAGNVLVVN